VKPPFAQDLLVEHVRLSLSRAPVVTSPFCHFAVTEAFPDALYAAMLDGLPPLSSYRPEHPEKYGRMDGTSARNVLPLTPENLEALDPACRWLWTAIGGALADDSIRRLVLLKLSPDLCRRFMTSESKLSGMTLYPRSSLVCDLGGYYIEPHPDSRAKVVTMQFYLARDDEQRSLGTTLYRLRPWHWRVIVKPSAAMEPVKQFAFAPNSGYGFAVTWKSFHGRALIPEARGARHTLMHVYYRVPDRAW
jgi:hypothetical protein